MTTLDERLRAQNEGQSWRDCNDAGLPHRWEPVQEVSTRQPGSTWSYWRCTRCPVRTIKHRVVSSRSVPAPYLAHDHGPRPTGPDVTWTVCTCGQRVYAAESGS